MNADPSWSCVLCRCPFAAADPTASEPACPHCGGHHVVAGELSSGEMERRHVRAFGATLPLLDALARERVPVHGHGRGLVPAEHASLLASKTVAVLVGRCGALALIDPPVDEAPLWHWRLFTQGAAPQVQDAGCAATPAKVVRGLAKAVHKATATDPDPDTAPDLGDLSSMADLERRLGPPLGAANAEVTPWGITLRDLDTGEIAIVDVQGRGTLWVRLLLPKGWGPKAASRRSPAALDWFGRTHGAAWAERGFETGRSGAPARVPFGSARRWAVLVGLSFDAFTIRSVHLAWAGDHRTLDLPVGP